MIVINYQKKKECMIVIDMHKLLLELYYIRVRGGAIGQKSGIFINQIS